LAIATPFEAANGGDLILTIIILGLSLLLLPNAAVTATTDRAIFRRLHVGWLKKMRAQCSAADKRDELAALHLVLPNKILGSCHAPQNIAHQDMGYGPTTPRWRGPGARTATSGRSESSRVIWVHGGGLSAAKRDSLLAEYAVGCRHHVLIGASFTTICQAGAVDR
jgi:hypothetical protein